MKQCPIDFFDPEVQHLAASAGCRLYRMQNDTGEGLISEYPILPEIDLFYNDFHMKDGQNQNKRPNPPPVRRSLQNLDFESRGDAEDTLAGLRDALYRYRQVSVGDLWDLMGVTNDSTDYNYGWYNLDDAFIKGIPGGFRLVLPHTVPLR